ncbi:hypothetical protein ACFQDD_00400 [Halorubrum pallidum]|uniref:Uncharacterized protein n=1 Tax=Halorubrum pallidum TaxID=1526114 RepID=A0ABD5SXQ2_9EURY
MAETNGTEEPKYACRECDWTGNQYSRVDDGTSGGRAVCGRDGCQGQLVLNRVPDV